jgi:magnesium-protoporphyrin O-methyltransferase
MICSQCQGIELTFSQAEVDAQMRRYRRRGPAATTRLLVDALLADGVQGRTLLDIGGGAGAIQHALLAAGLGRAVSVDASTAYLKAARQEAERRGVQDRIEAHHGDFVDLAASMPAADIVTLDRVICCYPDMRALVGLSSAKARARYGLVYPRNVWWLRPAFVVANLMLRLRRSPFRIFLHAESEVEAILVGRGMRETFRRARGIWQVAVFAV